MKSKRRNIAKLIVSTTLAIAVVSGCSSTGAGGESGKSSTPPGAAPSPQASTATADGKVLPNPMNLRVMVEESPSQAVLKDTPIIKEVQKQTNVTLQLEPVPTANYQEKKNALIATNNIPDVIKVSNTDLQVYGRTGIFLNISDYLQYAPNFKQLIDQRPEFKKMMVDGKIYAFPTLERFRVSVAPQAMIRTDLLKKLNLPTPKSFDDLYNVLKKLKEAYPDSIPLTARRGTLFMLGQLAYPMGSGGFPAFSTSGMYYEQNSDKYVYGPASAEFKDVLSYLNKLYTEKLLDPDYATNTQQQFIEKLSSGKALAYYDNNTISKDVNTVLKKSDPNAGFDLLDPLQNSKGQTRSYRYQRDWLAGNEYAISSKVKDPVSVVKFYDWMYSQGGTDVTNFGIKGETYDIVNNQYVIKDDILNRNKDKPSVMAAIQSELGAGLQAFAVNVDESTLKQINPPQLTQMADRIEKATGTTIQFIPEDPPLSKEESDQVKKIESTLNTLFTQEVDKFIFGVRPISEYENFRTQLSDKGATALEKIYNDAYARTKK